MKLVFDYPAKLYILENKYHIKQAAHAPMKFEYEGFNFLEFSCVNVYVNTKLEKLKFEKTFTSSIFMQIDEEHYMYVCSADNIINFQDRVVLTNSLENLKAIHAKMNLILENPEEYRKEKEDFIVQRKYEREIEDNIRKQKLAAKEKEDKENFESALTQWTEKFQNDEQIPFEFFEEICKRNDIQIHIRTLGAARKHITRIGKTNASVYKPVNGIWKYVKELTETLDQTDLPEDEEINRLFGIS